MPVFTGAAVAIITPMHQDASVNYAKLEELIDWQIAEGTDAIVICGTTGESSTLTIEEHEDVLRHCCSYVNGRVPVIAGTGSNDTAAAIDMSQEAEAAGADALLVVTPYYNKASQRGLVSHFTAIADSVHIPMILYNVPSRTGTNILPETAARLAEDVENIVGIKEASGDITQVTRLASIAGDAIDIYTGNDDQIVPTLSIGGIGVISVLSNVAPKFAHDMVMKYLEGDTQTAMKMQLDSLELIDALFCEVNPIPVKHAMNLMGRDVGPLRPPLYDMEPKNLERLQKALADFGLLGN